jgi:hypothetical protein
VHQLALTVSKRGHDYVTKRKQTGGYPFSMFNYQIVKNGKAYWFEREPKASFSIVDGKNCWHLRNFLKEELMPAGGYFISKVWDVARRYVIRRGRDPCC